MFDEQDEPSMRKEGHTSALREVIDMLTELEMKQHRPAPPAAAEPSMPPPGDDMGAAPPEEGSEGGLSPEDLAALEAELAKMKG